MAGIAIDRGVRARQWEAIVVILNLTDRNLPSANGVALLAICSELASMNICMAILAALSDVREDWLDVTLRAVHLLVQSAQRILRLIVIEFRNGADRAPRGRCVAVLAGNGEIPMRTMRSSGRLRPRSRRKPEERGEGKYY